MSDAPFWKQKSLEEMTREEWESLCDGCARCCLHKLEDVDTGEVHYTSVVCQYLDQDRCRCTEYERRNELVPNCVWLTPETAKAYKWLPSSCAYRMLAEGRDLEWWHPLVSGDPDTVRTAGISVQGRVVDERYVHPEEYEEQVIRWVEH
ncbi:MAG: YcgN family cysteine cluster protein [Pseudomonadales bacterium]|nr:YcgN family cysteine cluster protein [Pseudomonadales bacterium]